MMKNRFNFIGALFLTALLLTAGLSNARENYKLDANKSSLKISGTSTLHDWHMVAGKYDCNVESAFDGSKDLMISKVIFKCNTNSISSDNSIMDAKAREALKSDQFDDIIFQTTSENKIIVDGGTINGWLGGELQIAGQKSTSKLPIKGVIDTEGNVNVRGEITIRMSSYKMKPPTAMMGTIKTGDEITIHYEFFFSPNNR